MKELVSALSLVAVIVIPIVPYLSAQEKAVLTTPVITTVTEFEVTGLSFTRSPRWSLMITYTDNTGRVLTDVHQTPALNEGEADARTLILQLNKANLSVKSLERVLMEHLIKENKIPAATITGVPE